MKKTIVCIMFVLAMLAAAALPAFANTDSYVFAAPFYDGMPVNDGDIGAGTNKLRNTWTPSRGGHLNTVIMAEADGMLVMKVVAPQWFFRDSDNKEKTDSLMSIKRGDIFGFAGVVLNYGTDYTKKPEGSVTQNDSLFTEVEAVSSDASAKYVMPSGMGYTLLMDSTTKVRFFVRCFGTQDASGAYSFDVLYYDYDTGVDLGAGYHTYELYYDPDGLECRFYFDETYVCGVKYDHLDALACNSTLGEMTGQYYTDATLFDATGKEISKTDKALIANQGKCAFVASGEGTVFYVDYMENSSFVLFPDTAEETTEAPVTDAQNEDTTAAPGDETTAAAPVETTSAQAEVTTAAKEEKKGCASAAAGMLAVVMILGCAMVPRKKH